MKRKREKFNKIKELIESSTLTRREKTDLSLFMDTMLRELNSAKTDYYRLIIKMKGGV